MPHIEIRNDAARLERNRCLAGKPKLPPRAVYRTCKSARRIAMPMLERGGDVSDPFGVQEPRSCSDRIIDGRDRRQRPIVNLHKPGEVLRAIAISCNNKGDGLADKADAIQCKKFWQPIADARMPIAHDRESDQGDRGSPRDLQPHRQPSAECRYRRQRPHSRDLHRGRRARSRRRQDRDRQ